MERRHSGFTLIEILVVVSVIAVLATIVMTASGTVLRKARDTKRKAAIAQVGRFLAGTQCFLPDAGDGDYDFGAIFAELKAKNPQYAAMMTSIPKDPSGGTDTVTKYRYAVAEAGSVCALYANLENDSEAVTLPSLTAPTPGKGSGVLRAATAGPNGSDRYFQVSNR